MKINVDGTMNEWKKGIDGMDEWLLIIAPKLTVIIEWYTCTCDTL